MCFARLGCCPRACITFFLELPISDVPLFPVIIAVKNTQVQLLFRRVGADKMQDNYQTSSEVIRAEVQSDTRAEEEAVYHLSSQQLFSSAL